MDQYVDVSLETSVRYLDHRVPARYITVKN